MNQDEHQTRSSIESVQADLLRQPHLMMRLAENALTVAESLRDNYFKNTAHFIALLRAAIDEAARGQRFEPILHLRNVTNTDWSSLNGELVSFLDGGIGQVEFSNQVPILLRVGSYSVRTGEHNLAEREKFGYYPVILGDLEGGSKERKDFTDIVRITAELLGGLAVLDRTPDLRVLMLHGPLVYLMSGYAGHTPFTERDIDLFLDNYAHDSSLGEHLKEEFLHEAQTSIYPRLTDESHRWIKLRLFEPLSWIAFLYRHLIREAKKRNPSPMIIGVVERNTSSTFIRSVLLERVFDGLRAKQNGDYFNSIFHRSDLTTPKNLVARLGYTDSLLLAMLLKTGQFTEAWLMQEKYEGLTKGEIELPNEPGIRVVDFAGLKPDHPNRLGFPDVYGFYLAVSELTEPLRIEVFGELSLDQISDVARRVFMYSKLLPGYGFPVGLDVADKYAHVPNWLTNAYAKIIRHSLGVSLQRGEISDAEMRRILVQSIYMTHRDWLFRPRN